jgi:hypothetical protein
MLFGMEGSQIHGKVYCNPGNSVYKAGDDVSND